MKLQPATQLEFKRITIGVLSGSALMVLVFAIIGQFQMRVVWGALLGSAVAILNFLYLCISVQKAAGDSDRARLIMKSSYTTRLLITCLALVLGFALDVVHPVAVVIPLLLPRATIYVLQMTGAYKPGKPADPKEKEGE